MAPEGRKRKVSRITRAGLHIRPYKLTDKIKSVVGKRRIGKNASILVGACGEYLVTQLLMHTAGVSTDKAHLKALDFHKALNDPKNPVYGVFPNRVGGIH